MSTLRVAVMMPLVLCTLLAALASERTLSIRDWTGRGFAPDVVTYTVDARQANKLRLYDAAAKPMAVQIAPGQKKQALLSFVAEVGPNATVQYTVRNDGKGAVPATAVTATPTRDGLTLANGLLAVRLPGIQTTTFKIPVAANTLPAPILAFRGAEGIWKGHGSLLATRPVKACSQRLLAKGPVYCEARYELQFAAGGYYRATIRVEDRVPLVKVSEEYDPGVLDGTDAWELNLTTGWQPDRMEVARTCGNGQVDAGHVEPLDNLAKKSPCYLVPDSAWGQPLSQLGLFPDTAQKATPETYPMAGIVPLHKGDWRNMNALEIQSTGAADVRVRFPMSRRYASWLREVTSETSPFSMQEHEPGLSKTYSLRHWGLVLAKPALTCAGEGGGALGPFYQARLFYGVVGLNRYKDFILDWPDTGVQYPRVYVKAGELEQDKKKLHASSLPEDMKQKLLDGVIALGAEGKGPIQTQNLLRRLAGIANVPMVSPTIGHHWTAQQYTVAAQADDLLGWAKLPAETRAEIRARAALICYLWEEGDVISYADGSHSGNPNMGTARFAPIVSFLPLVPDHPMFARWRAHMAQYLAYKATTQTAPGGGYFEYGAAYHMHGYARVMNVLPALQAAGAPVSQHLLDADKEIWRYYMNLLTPVDSRWKYRVYPGLANSPPGLTEHTLEAAGEIAPRDPALAANLAWAWQATGGNYGSDPLDAMNGMLALHAPAPQAPALQSEIYPGVGVIFRAHQGPDETYLFLRAGNNWSHWTEDQGNMILMSRGATLLPFQPYQYWWVQNPAFDDKSSVRFGHPENKIPHAWPDSNIIDHAFGPSVDYAWQVTGFPDWYITPGATPEFGGKVDAPVGTGGARKLADGIAQQQGAFDWHRQVLFLKGKAAVSPNYFVIRDTTTGDGALASWLNLDLLGTKDGVKVDGGNLLVDTEWPVKLDVRFPGATLKPDFYEERQFVSLGRLNGASWWNKDTPISRNWTDKDGKPTTGEVWEQHTMVRLPAGPGQGYFWLLYPRMANEPAPTTAIVAPGVMKIVHPEGTDYAILSPTPVTFAVNGLTFAGRAGAIRVAKDGTATLVTCGGNDAGAQPTVTVNGSTVRFVAPGPGYVKLHAGNVGVRGMGPFDLTFTDDHITGTVSGSTRTLAVTWPAKIVRPMYRMDGNRWYAGWADDHSITKGTATPQFGLAFGVTAGTHTVEVSEWTYPDLPSVPIQAQIKF